MLSKRGEAQKPYTVCFNIYGVLKKERKTLLGQKWNHQFPSHGGGGRRELYSKIRVFANDVEDQSLYIGSDKITIYASKSPLHYKLKYKLYCMKQLWILKKYK